MAYICLFILSIMLLKMVQPEELPTRFRLQHKAIPKYYNIKIRPIMDQSYFIGEVIILIEVPHTLKNITLNSKSLKISAIVLDNYINNTGHTIDEENELLNIFYKDESYIDPGEHFVYIAFTGLITSNSTGIFRTSDSIATMFSASNARMAFPCFDDPAYKAKFSVRIIKPDNTYKALSNMEKINSFRTQEGIAVDFRSTPPISPYLLCFVITKYNYSLTKYVSSNGSIVPIRLFMMDEYREQAPFLLNVGKNSLSFFEEYTNLSYPTSKLDIIEVEDFSSQGMENIGLIILRRNAVSFNESQKISKIDHQRNAAVLMVHEISHMWFGDIVTHEWYNDLWLTEGFAQFMQYKGLQHQHPEWRVMETEEIMSNGYLFYYEISAVNTSPVVIFPNNHQQVEAQFEELLYSKSLAILKMLEMVMGPEIFKLGVRKYLRNYYFKTATTGDFISIMQESSKLLNLRGFLLSWLYQNRYPLVIVTKNDDSNNYILKQANFYKGSGEKSIFGYKWTIPITYISSCNKNVTIEWFDRDADELFITKCEGEKWIKFNYNAIGYYRVLYTEEHYQQLLDHFEELPEVDQGNLIEETFQLMRHLPMSCKIPLKFVEKLKNRNNLIPVLASLQNIEIILSDMKWFPEVIGKLRAYFIQIFKDLYEKLTWTVNEGDDYNTRTLRSSLFKTMCRSNLSFKKCFDDVANISEKAVKIHPDVVNTFTDVLKAIERTRKKEAMSKIPSVKSIFASFYPLKHSHPSYVEICYGWLLNNL